MVPELVTLLEEKGSLVTPELIQAFRAVPRDIFVPHDLQELASRDMPLPIGYGQTISQPSTVALMLELLEPQAGQHVLDVGSGSGWTTALLCAVVGEKGRVVALERLPELHALTKSNPKSAGFSTAGIEVHCTNGAQGYPSQAPYDRILVSAAANRVPNALFSQLKKDGILVMPLGGRVVRLLKKNETAYDEEEFPGFVFVPLVEE